MHYMTYFMYTDTLVKILQLYAVRTTNLGIRGIFFHFAVIHGQGAIFGTLVFSFFLVIPASNSVSS